MIFTHLAGQIHTILVFVLGVFSLTSELTCFCLLKASPHLTPVTSGLPPTYLAKYSVPLTWFFSCSTHLPCGFFPDFNLSLVLAPIFYMLSLENLTHGFNYYLFIIKKNLEWWEYYRCLSSPYFHPFILDTYNILLAQVSHLNLTQLSSLPFSLLYILLFDKNFSLFQQNVH